MNKEKLKQLLKEFRSENSLDGKEWVVVSSKDMERILEAILED